MIHFVGAGPGAPDLLTLRGATLLGRADVVVYAGSLVNPELLALAPADCVVHDSSRMTLEQIVDVMATAHAQGLKVVRLHTGDPSLYGTTREQMHALEARGVPYDVTPGVSSLFGAAASLKAEYTLPDVSQTLVVTRLAGRTPVPEAERLRDLARHQASMAVFLSAGMLARVQEELLCGGYDPESPAAIVYKATWPDERVVRTTVGTLARDGEAAGIRSTALILVGDFLDGRHERSRLYDPAFSTGLREASHATTPAQNTKRGARKAADLRFVSFTDVGEVLASRLAQDMGGTSWRCTPGGLAQWVGNAFDAADALVFVGATGIAVRAIAPHVRSKAFDPAVVVVDEQGGFAIPLLSGHLGGANDLARRIAKACGAQPAITTATDVRGVFAVDEWAKGLGCAIVNPARIKSVSAKLLAGATVRVASDWPLPPNAPRGIEFGDASKADVILSMRSDVEPDALQVVPRILSLGVGCRRGTRGDALLQRVRNLMARAGLRMEALVHVCTIDAKANEPAILELCRELGLPLRTYSAERLAAVPGEFAHSPFVLQTTGVDNVCERSAVLGSGGGTLVRGKEAGEGITLALAAEAFLPTWRWSHD